MREFDVVIFGATGFTGGLTAKYLAQNAPKDLRLALAGRNRAKLEAVRKGLGKPDLPILIADVGDQASVDAVARSTRVVVTTVGPFIDYGEALVKACADAGTDYIDSTGEPEFIDLMYAKYHETAVKTGARLVHACGFDSIPHDLGAYFTVKHLPEGVPLTVEAVVRSNGTFSGGTFHSAVTAAARWRHMNAARGARKEVEPRVQGRSSRSDLGRITRRDGLWLVPMPTVDPQIVARSGRALERYGPKFTYRHYAGIQNLTTVLGGGAGLTALAVGAQIGPVRSQILKRVTVGEGPSPERRSKSWFTVTFTGTGGGSKVVTRVSGGDPGYDETAKMLAESALCLALDELPKTAGQVTTAVAMGDALIDRLVNAGISFEVLERS